MQKKTPQGYDMPNSTPEAELEKYGVWVKAEPQDIIEEPETEHSLLGAVDLSADALPDGDLSMDDFSIPEFSDERSAQDLSLN
ncbi:MAG TPA: hypothetical protein PLC54_03835, partial [Spirochaetales bacterium]|nr:hypothetical protein [Spirochaetales bacterium]